MSSKKFSEEQINSTRLILADFDGTLLHTDKKLSSLIRPTVDMLHKRGILFAVATARACNTSFTLMQDCAADIAVFHNGVVIDYDFKESGSISYEEYCEKITCGSEDIEQKCIDSNLGYKFCSDILNCMPDLHVAVIIDDIRYANFDMNCIWPGIRFVRSDLREFKKGHIQKINAYPANDSQIAKLEELKPDNISLNIAENTLWMFAHPAASKENSLNSIADRLNFSTQNVISFGDDIIDEGMIKKAGIGVAMGNAIEPLKKIADDICDTNDDDGVAHWLMKYFSD